MKKKHVWGIAALTVIVGCCILSAVIYQWLYRPTFRIQERVQLFIDADDTVDSVQTKIRLSANPRSERGFTLLCALSEYHIKTGCYVINPEENMLTVFRKLRNGLQTPIRLTLPSVRTIERLAAVLDKRLMLDSATIATKLTDTLYCRQLGYEPHTIASLFIPNTYEMYWNIGFDEFMRRMVKEHGAFWNEERKAKAAKIGLNELEVATLASIVDAETNANIEKPMVAGMYLNRLRIRMPLQADPTIVFAMGDFGKRRVYRADLKYPSPYNTYLNKGLPPGPIRIPSMAGLEAVLNPAKHQYLYMCAKEDFSGTHNFARTYSEHIRNARKYSRALNQRGIK